MKEERKYSILGWSGLAVGLMSMIDSMSSGNWFEFAAGVILFAGISLANEYFFGRAEPSDWIV